MAKNLLYTPAFLAKLSSMSNSRNDETCTVFVTHV